MIKKYCDRCGEELKDKTHYPARTWKELSNAVSAILADMLRLRPRFSIVDKKSGRELELCRRCEKEFDRFMSEPYGPEGRPEDIQDEKKLEIVVADEETGK